MYLHFPEKVVKAKLNQIIYMSIMKIHELKQIISDLALMLQEHSVHIIIFDGFLTPFLEFDEELYKLHLQVVDLMKKLYLFSDKYPQVAIILTNRSVQENIY